MIGKLITLPLRISLKTTSLALRGAREVTASAFGAGEQVLSMLRSNERDGHGRPAPPRDDDRGRARERAREEATREQDRGEASREEAPRAAHESAAAPEAPSSDMPRRDPRRTTSTNGTEPPAAEPRPAPPEPPAELRQNVIDLDAPPEPLDPRADHVSEEVTLVEERADPGVEDGAGAQIRIDEPFKGYGALKAQDVIARVSAADEAQLTAIRLYEGMNRKRETVLRAVDRRFARLQNDHH
jgi:hypothetical protein